MNQTKLSLTKKVPHLLTLLMIITISLSLSACADFKDEQQPAQPTQTPQQPTPKPEPAPRPPPPPSQPRPTPRPDPTPPLQPPTPTETDAQRNHRLCEAERQWALRSGLIDVSEFRLYENRNFAPVFNTPGVRQSGIDGWINCVRVLEINGFIPFH